MTRSKSLMTAAILAALLGILDVIGSLPIPARSSNLPLQNPPFFIVVFFLITAVAGLFGAYGLWKDQRWGRILTIVIRVVIGLLTVGEFLMAPMVWFKAAAAIYVLVSIVVIFLVLQREPRPTTALG